MTRRKRSRAQTSGKAQTPRPRAQTSGKAQTPRPREDKPAPAAPATGEPTARRSLPPAPLGHHPLVRAGAYAWALIGLAAALVGLALVAAELRIIVVPLVVALFPAALLSPLVRWLVAHRLPPAVATIIVLVGSLGLLVGVVRLLTPAIAAELPGLGESMQDGIAELQEYLERGPFGIDPALVTELLESGREQLIVLGQEAAGTAAAAVAEGIAGVVFVLVALFFYLKDGGRIAAWLGGLFPAQVRADADTIGTGAWVTIGAYFRGQLFIAVVDAVFIGLGLALLRVPLALPLAVLVFFGALFPIVGALISGTVAVLVALADGGIAVALAVLAIVLAVQQVEGNVLAPIVLGKATALHPLAVILALAAGGVTLGVLGAFLAVPVAASIARAIGHVRDRRKGVSPAAPAAAGDP